MLITTSFRQHSLVILHKETALRN